MPLFAKSRHNGLQPTLAEHTRAVMDAFESLFGRPGGATRLTRRWRKFFKLDEVDAFLLNGLAASAFHDIGKANDGFQDAVTGRGSHQLIRHEHLSGLILALPAMQDWLGTAGSLDVEMIIAAVVSHHLKVSDRELGKPQDDTARVMQVYSADAHTLVKEVGGRLGLQRDTFPDVPANWRFQARRHEFDLGGQIRHVRARLDGLDDDLDSNEPRRRLLWAVRAGLIVADAAGSGLVREGKPVTDWIAEEFDENQLCDGAKIRDQVIEPRVRQLGGKFRGWSKFQEQAAELPERALLLAPCGSGKTLAAWRWIEARLRHEPAKRVIFLYPTRGTATEGFRDYVSFAPESDAALMHGTARYDLEDMFANVEDERSGKSFEGCERLFALKNWPKRIFSATVDQFLGFLQHGYGSTCQLPLLADAVVVIDEVHSFDHGMFSALADFLRAFDVPVLCMTATLPQRRQRVLSQGGLEVYNQRPGDLRKSAGYPRYRVCETTRDSAIERVREALAGNGRVLWVVNQVSRAQELARSLAADGSPNELRTAEGVPVYCYHSRFRLKDRGRRHQDVIGAFRAGHGADGVLAVTTQVCEMSLDLDADLLVTEWAPITSLIQRMGRCCREAHPKEGRCGEVLVYPPENHLPYGCEEVRDAPDFVRRLAEMGCVSQDDLENALEDAPAVAQPRHECLFLSSGPYAMAGTFRDTEQFSRQAVLASDVEEYLRLYANLKTRWRAEGLTLPVPKRFADSDARLPRYLSVAPEQHYRPTLGFMKE